MKLLCIWTLCLILTAGCESSIISSPVKYVAYLDEHSVDVSDSVLVEDLIFSIRYLPQDYIALHAYGAKMFADSMDRIMENYSGFEYYEFSIFSPSEKTKEKLLTLYSGQNIEDFDTYINFGIQMDFEIMKDNGDAQPCAYLHREVSDAITNRVKFTLAFPVSERENDGIRMVSFKPSKLTIEPIILSLSNKQIESLPQLKID